MPRAEVPEAVERFYVGVCGHCGETVDEFCQGHHHEVPPSSSPKADGERPKVLVVASNVEMVRTSDLPALHAHWLDQLKEELLSDAVIDKLAEENAIAELYGHWEDFPAKEANQRRRYEQLAKKPGVQESWKAGARRDVERFLETLASIPIEGEGRS